MKQQLTDHTNEQQIINLAMREVSTMPKPMYFTHTHCIAAAKHFEASGELPTISQEYCKRAGVPIDWVLDINEMDAFGDPKRYMVIFKDLYQRKLALENLQSEAKSLLDFSKRMVTDDAIVLDAEAQLQAYEESAKLYGQGIRFGFPAFDSVMGGLKVGQLFTIVAGSGTFKTTLAMNLLFNAAHENQTLHSIFFSYEMDTGDWVNRMLEIYTGLTGKEVNQVRKSHQWEELREAYKQSMQRIRLVTRQQDISSMAQIIREQSRDHRIGLIAIDYLDFIPHSRQNDKDWVNWAVRELKQLAKAEKISVLLLTQIDKSAGAAKDRISMWNARGGSGVKDSADYGFCLWQNENKEIVGYYDKARSVFSPDHLRDDFVMVRQNLKVVDLMPRSRS